VRRLPSVCPIYLLGHSSKIWSMTISTASVALWLLTWPYHWTFRYYILEPVQEIAASHTNGEPLASAFTLFKECRLRQSEFVKVAVSRRTFPSCIVYWMTDRVRCPLLHLLEHLRGQIWQSGSGLLKPVGILACCWRYSPSYKLHNSRLFCQSSRAELDLLWRHKHWTL